MRRVVILLLILFVLTACSGDDDKKPAKVFENTTLLNMPWQRVSTPITADNAVQLKLVGVLNGHRGTVFKTAFNANGNRYATLGGDEQLNIWSLANGRQVVSLLDANLREVKFLSDGDTFLTLDIQNNLAKRSLSDENALQQINVYDQVYTSWAFSPDESLVAIGMADGRVKVFQVETLELAGEFIAHHGGFSIPALYFSPNGNVLYTVGGEGRIRSWNTVTWEIISEIEDNSLRLIRTAVSPDGSKLVVARVEQMTIYDTDTGDRLHQLTIPFSGNISAMKFTNDGQWIGLGGDIDSVMVFDVNTGDLVVALPGHKQSFADFAFSPDHDLIVTGISGGTAFLWNLKGLLTENIQSQQVQVPQAQLKQVSGLRLHKVDWSPGGTQLMLIDRQGPIYVLGVE